MYIGLYKTPNKALSCLVLCNKKKLHICLKNQQAIRQPRGHDHLVYVKLIRSDRINVLTYYYTSISIF